MSRYAYDGTTKLIYVADILDMEAPTVTELEAGIELSGFLPKDGWNAAPTHNNVDDDALADTFDGKVPGTWGSEPTLTAKRDNVDDDVWDLVEYGLEGFIVARYGFPVDDAWATGDLVEVWPGSFHQPAMNPPAANTQARFTVPFPVRSPGPELKAVVAT